MKGKGLTPVQRLFPHFFNLEQLSPETTEHPNLALSWHLTPHSQPGWAGSHTLHSFPSAWPFPGCSPPHRATAPMISLSHQGDLQRGLELDSFQGLQKCSLDAFPANTMLGSERIVWKTKALELAFLHLACTALLGIKESHLFCIRQTGKWHKATLGTYHSFYVPWLGFKAAVGRRRLRGHLIPQAHQLLLNSSPSALHHFLVSLLVLKQFFPPLKVPTSPKASVGCEKVWGSVLSQCPSFWGFCCCAIFTALSHLALSTSLGSSIKWTSLTQHLAKPGWGRVKTCRLVFLATRLGFLILLQEAVTTAANSAGEKVSTCSCGDAKSHIRGLLTLIFIKFTSNFFL